VRARDLVLLSAFGEPVECDSRIVSSIQATSVMGGCSPCCCLRCGCHLSRVGLDGARGDSELAERLLAAGRGMQVEGERTAHHGGHGWLEASESDAADS
jgi:hypothetical protein